MKKFIMMSVLSVFLLNSFSVSAEPIILSDIIREAKEKQMKQEAKEKAELAMMQPVKNGNAGSNKEQMPCELNNIIQGSESTLNSKQEPSE